MSAGNGKLPKLETNAIKATLDGAILDTLRTLIVALVSREDRVYEMGEYAIDPEKLADAHSFEISALKAIYSISDMADKDTPPTLDNVKLLLASRHGHQYASQLDGLMQSYQKPTGSILLVAKAVYDEIQTRLQNEFARFSFQIINGPYGGFNEKYELLQDALGYIAPEAEEYQETDGADLILSWKKRQEERIQTWEKGNDIGPTFHLAGLRRLIPAIPKGNAVVITARTKFGKSWTAAELADWIALNQKNFYVVLFAVETTPEENEDRFAARVLQVRGDLILNKEKKVDPRTPENQTKINRANAFRKSRLIKNNSTLKYVYAPGTTPHTFGRYVVKWKKEAARLGQELVVIADYFQAFTFNSGLHLGEATVLNRAANFFKMLTAKHGIWLFMFAQDDPNLPYKNNSTDIIIRGGRDIGIRFQIYIRIERVWARADEPKWADEHRTVQAVDAAGEPIFWHRAGDPHCLTRFHVVRANNARTGSAWAYMHNGYFTTYDAEPPQDFRTWWAWQKAPDSDAPLETKDTQKSNSGSEEGDED